ncbi:type I-E CRISPR-associated protein Cas5/CasD [Streptomyces sp. NBC_01500]|uniref:type I-E CRISPR-associated protein Cas5/CasD n=1 Tax=Streptomyces sp. NBC_01500 TaxID=2903886 RepID=UPI0022574459|nr:type I-E CRISPR-associated protein Cas5/CasD [Streptomyces sp. NBC_01500]MCX4554284.1 type I-E CRISPR-associated protein Cas5/CasD [Streptomyces sp. NBC_01500]
MSTAAQPTPPPRPPAEYGLLLRLTGPLQSWGLHSHFNDRDTAPFPTRSGIIGLLACALGRTRHDPIDDLTRLSLTVRTDRPGVLLRDLHTVGGGLPAKSTVTTAEGKKRSGDTGTLLTHRTYLADAAFTIALTTHNEPGDGRTLLAHCAEALRHPRWPLYLGRRSCPPEGPLLLGESEDALHDLIHLPLSARPPRSGDRGKRCPVDFLADRPLTQLPVPPDAVTPGNQDGTHPSSELNDQPTQYHPSRRTYRARPLYRRTLALPASQFAGLGLPQLTALAAYINTHLTTSQGSRQ